MSMSGPPLPTPECIDVSSVTPDSVKSPTPPAQVNASAADGGGGTAEAESTNAANDTATEDRSGSPPPSCPICLGTYKNKCFTDSCLHQFCFNCLLEWSKVSHEFTSTKCVSILIRLLRHPFRSRQNVRCANRASSRSFTMLRASGSLKSIWCSSPCTTI